MHRFFKHALVPAMLLAIAALAVAGLARAQHNAYHHAAASHAPSMKPHLMHKSAGLLIPRKARLVIEFSRIAQA